MQLVFDYLYHEYAILFRKSPYFRAVGTAAIHPRRDTMTNIIGFSRWFVLFHVLSYTKYLTTDAISSVGVPPLYLFSHWPFDNV